MKLINYYSKRFISDSLSVQEQMRRNQGVKIWLLLYIIAIIWGVSYFLMGATVSAVAPLMYVICSTITILVTGYFNWYYVFVQIHLALLIIAPALMHILLGSIHDAALVVSWAVMSPIGAIFFLRSKWLMIIWLIVCIAIILSLFLLRNEIGFLEQNMFFDQEKVSYPITLFMNTIGSSLVFLTLLLYLRKKIYTQEDQIKKIIYDSFPTPIAEKMFETDDMSVEIKEYKRVSIMFIKFYSSKESGEVFVKSLSRIFKMLDNTIEGLNVYKIKTVSNVYIVGTGLILQENIHGLINLAQSVNMLIGEINKECNVNINFKVGINSGAIIAGVIGNKKKSYDVWGDVVNVASRLANSQYENSIMLSKESYQKVKDDYTVVLHSQEYIKGKGEADIYEVKGKIAS